MDIEELFGHVVAGALAGATVELVLYPIDTIKTRLQAVRDSGTVHFRHLYKGVGGNIVGVIPACAMFFAVYEPSKRLLLPSNKEGPVLAPHLLAATAAGLASSVIRVPTEVIKSRMQTGQFAGARQAVWHVLRYEGVRNGLFAGFGSFLLRDLPFDAIEFTAYEYLKISLASLRNRDELETDETAFVGAFAGMFTGAVTTPLDVIKTRLMTQGGGSKLGEAKYPKSIRYRGIWDCFSRIVRDEGWSALFKGLGPRVTMIGMGGGIFFWALETARGFFAKQG